MQNRVLLHACCGICSSYPIENLRELGYEPSVFFYNPNIYPEEEYLKRLEAEKILCKAKKCELIIDEYNQSDFFSKINGFENEPEKGKRCDICFKIRLEKTAKLAKKMNIGKFTTSIVISPHKNFEKISSIGFYLAKQYDLEYLSIDFKKKDGFLKTNKISKELNLYRQNYCGCKFSQRKD